jgi:hypothetical protein
MDCQEMGCCSPYVFVIPITIDCDSFPKKLGMKAIFLILIKTFAGKLIWKTEIFGRFISPAKENFWNWNGRET